MKTGVRLLLLALIPAMFVAAQSTDSSLPAVELVRVFPALAFERPVFLTHAGDDSEFLYVIEQEGIIHRIDPASPGRTDVFLDISPSVTRGGNEEGLLGLAFSPKFAENGRFYVYYSSTNPRRSVLSRFETGADGLADTESEVLVLEVGQPFPNHNGGMISFGPDGMLYVGLGDGGSAGDPHRNGQNPGTLLGTILRIDPEQPAQDAPYAIPNDNPFVGDPGARGEVWAYGLRNPWRFSFDRATGELWVGDVGQNAREEIDIVYPGANYGWNVMEGSTCFRTRSCSDDGLQAPVVEYGHDLGCSVTGGYVYRGQRMPALNGVYLYADFCSGRIWGLRYDGTDVTAQAELARAPFEISSFGEDAGGEVYVLGFDGGIYTFATSPSEAQPTTAPTSASGPAIPSSPSPETGPSTKPPPTSAASPPAATAAPTPTAAPRGEGIAASGWTWLVLGLIGGAILAVLGVLIIRRAKAT